MAGLVRLVATITLATAPLLPASAQAVSCEDVAAYPGDAAAKTAIAQRALLRGSIVLPCAAQTNRAAHPRRRRSRSPAPSGR